MLTYSIFNDMIVLIEIDSSVGLWGRFLYIIYNNVRDIMKNIGRVLVLLCCMGVSCANIYAVDDDVNVLHLISAGNGNYRIMTPRELSGDIRRRKNDAKFNLHNDSRYYEKKSSGIKKAFKTIILGAAVGAIGMLIIQNPTAASTLINGGISLLKTAALGIGSLGMHDAKSAVSWVKAIFMKHIAGKSHEPISQCF